MIVLAIFCCSPKACYCACCVRYVLSQSKKLGTIIFTHFAREIGVRLAKINALAHALQLTAVLCHHDGLYLECSTVLF